MKKLFALATLIVAACTSVPKDYAADVCAERDDPKACERQWEKMNRIGARLCPNGTNNWSEKVPDCD